MAFVYLLGHQMKFKKSRLASLSDLELGFFIVLWSKLKKTLHYYSYIVSNTKNLHSVLEQCCFGYKNKRSNMKSKK